ncbi:cytochrome c oxidase subunit II [Baekduia sp.]|uniref:cytochrome c oxidase subunit II n=1 Tax=Baekduia sp. TaxID=2600305 RepID=UPI002DFA0F70|nr:cytochrome c oxidase subunit II [Baekduia sp.]
MSGGADTRGAFSGLFDLYVPIAVGVFALVVIALAVIVLRDRARPGGPPPSLRSSAARFEIGYAVVLALVAALLVWRSFDSVHRVNQTVARAAPAPRAGPAGLTIAVVGAKWNWRFTYPGGVVEQGEGPARLPTLVVPAGQPVRFRLTSADVVHAFWIPEARFKYDAIPGRTNTFDLRFDPGVDYRDDRCSEFCGQYHEQMRFRVVVKAPAAFRAWLRARQGEAAAA